MLPKKRPRIVEASEIEPENAQTSTSNIVNSVINSKKHFIDSGKSTQQRPHYRNIDSVTSDIQPSEQQQQPNYLDGDNNTSSVSVHLQPETYIGFNIDSVTSDLPSSKQQQQPNELLGDNNTSSASLQLQSETNIFTSIDLVTSDLASSQKQQQSNELLVNNNTSLMGQSVRHQPDPCFGSDNSTVLSYPQMSQQQKQLNMNLVGSTNHSIHHRADFNPLQKSFLNSNSTVTSGLYQQQQSTLQQNGYPHDQQSHPSLSFNNPSSRVFNNSFTNLNSTITSGSNQQQQPTSGMMKDPFFKETSNLNPFHQQQRSDSSSIFTSGNFNQQNEAYYPCNQAGLPSTYHQMLPPQSSTSIIGQAQIAKIKSMQNNNEKDLGFDMMSRTLATSHDNSSHNFNETRRETYDNSVFIISDEVNYVDETEKTEQDDNDDQTSCEIEDITSYQNDEMNRDSFTSILKAINNNFTALSNQIRKNHEELMEAVLARSNPDTSMNNINLQESVRAAASRILNELHAPIGSDPSRDEKNDFKTLVSRLKNRDDFNKLVNVITIFSFSSISNIYFFSLIFRNDFSS